MSIPVPRAPKTRFTAPARAVPAPEEVSAGGLIIDFDRPEQLPVAIIARINRNGQREWCLPKGHIEHGETTVEAAQREISEETGITGYPVASLGTIAYWFTSNGTRIHKTVHHYLFAATGGELSIGNRRRMGPPRRAPHPPLIRQRTTHRPQCARIHHHPALNTR